jgi:copper chaperone
VADLKNIAQKFLSGKGWEDDSVTLMTEMKLTVEGMSCGHCEAAVEGEFGKLEGVERSDADFEKGTVEVRYDESRVSDGDLRGAVEESGYRVTG